MKSRADWGNRQGNSARCFLNVLNEINNLGRHFEPYQPHPDALLRRPFGAVFAGGQFAERIDQVPDSSAGIRT